MGYKSRGNYVVNVSICKKCKCVHNNDFYLCENCFNIVNSEEKEIKKQLMSTGHL